MATEPTRYVVYVKVDLSKTEIYAPLVEATSEDEAKQKVQKWLDEQAPFARSISWGEADIWMELDGDVRFEAVSAEEMVQAKITNTLLNPRFTDHVAGRPWPGGHGYHQAKPDR